MPIKISKYSEADIDYYESLGIDCPESDGEDGMMYVNPSNISSFLPYKDIVEIELSGGTRLHVYLSLEEFIEKLNDK